MTCGIQFSGWGLGPKDKDGCRLPDGHAGPHEFISVTGTVYRWETDWECNCEHCRTNDGDYCSTYWEHKEQTK
jgi:hypothetical protein